MRPLAQTLSAIPQPSEAAGEAARARLETLTKPSGSLGRLEALAIQLAALTGRPRPRVDRKRIVVCAADHGIADAGVSAYPPDVTAQMLANFRRGGAAINVLARQLGAELRVVDVGVRGTGAAPPHKIREGTRDFRSEPALTRAEAERALEAGIALAEPTDLLATGDMGIGNTTSGAALVCVLTGAEPDAAVGRGTGVDDATLARKRTAVRAALAHHRPDPKDPLGALACVGGLEIAALAGLILGGAARRIPVLLDGLASGAAALVASALEPRARAYCIASHVSTEPAHALALAHLGCVPLIDLGLRLGEGSGAALAMPLLDAACRLLDEMATFEEAAVDGRSESQTKT